MITFIGASAVTILIALVVIHVMGPLLLTWFNFNPNMDM